MLTTFQKNTIDHLDEKKGSVSEGEVTRLRHFYSSPNSIRCSSMDRSSSNLRPRLQFLIASLSDIVAVSHKFNAGCGSAARVRGNEVRSWRDHLTNPQSLLLLFFSTTSASSRVLLAIQTFIAILLLDKNEWHCALISRYSDTSTRILAF